MKTKINKTRKQGWITLIALVIIAFAIYIGFSPLFELIKGGIAGRVLGSSFGAIFVIILTMFLLNKQTEIEQESKKSERVFDEGNFPVFNSNCSTFEHFSVANMERSSTD